MRKTQKDEKIKIQLKKIASKRKMRKQSNVKGNSRNSDQKGRKENGDKILLDREGPDGTVGISFDKL